MADDNIQSAEEKLALKKGKDLDHSLEIVVVVMLGITALLTAWATWIGSLHGGNSATNYAVSNNLASEGNAEYNAGVQNMMQDMLLWNEISDLQIDIAFAQSHGDELALEQAANKLFFKLDDNLSEEMAEALGWDFNYQSEDVTETVLAWMENEQSLISPFIEEGFTDRYFESANALLDESSTKMKLGDKEGLHGDAYGLVTVIYSVVLFLLGIAGTIKSRKNRIVIITISLVSLLIATIYMFTLPLPTDFSIKNFFGQG